MKRLTKEIFINRSSKIHKLKYDYSNVEYKNNSTKVCIICPIHGDFYQTPQNHMNGKGCPKCKSIATGERCRYSTEQFILSAKKVHRDRYDYSKVKYKDAKTKVCIICPIHGEFWQVPNYHIDGCGCPECGKEQHHTHSMSGSKIYKVHSGMTQRCNNPHNSAYKYYGARGISVCKEWLRFESFYEWAINNGYKDGLTIERINVNGNYEPSNCKWIPQREQFYNMRKTKFVNLYGKRISLSEIKYKLNIKSGILEYYFIRYGNDRVVSYLENKYYKELVTIGFSYPYANELIICE